MNEDVKNKSGLAVASLVLGIVGIIMSFIPIINNLAFFMGVIAIIFSIICFVKKASTGMAVAGIILAVLTIIITINAQRAVGNALNEVGKDLDKATGNSTEEILKNDVEVTLGNFEITEGKYGINESKLDVHITNKNKETQSFNVQIEAVDENGKRIETDYVYANNLNPGQSQDFETFKYISSDKVEQIKNATFKIVSASMY